MQRDTFHFQQRFKIKMSPHKRLERAIEGQALKYTS